ncbi:coiled-coil domain-containing protein 78-like isoform X1 [Pomacea canaliculata]|uniref:coiled-coil domain-containing protein 78-like isoform X1 n=1 Tax=Pomacea canaliculata TaxID=400727 RepID=UPI000D7302DC|nr:coiled-coil domain-containing protein 78-like isoform X1 [Pomacea canaliculata]XP_025111598.1 coiled-coil domain-containing protein 78-like isoform X1 [Pomacea canaliculata]
MSLPRPQHHSINQEGLQAGQRYKQDSQQSLLPARNSVPESHFRVTMNIDVIGRIHQTLGATNLHIDGTKRVTAHVGGPYFEFHTLHTQKASTYDVFRLSVEPLLELFLTGYNACLLIAGEKGSGKTYTLAGDNSHTGLIQMALDHIFQKLSDESYVTHPDHLTSQRKLSQQDAQVSMQVLEVYDELIRDLLQVPHGGAGFLDVSETAGKGTQAKNAKTVSVTDASSGITVFHQGLRNASVIATDSGPAQHDGALIIHIDLVVKTRNNLSPYKSRLTFVELPSLDKLSVEQPKHIHQREGRTLNKGLLALSQVVSSLASNLFPDRVINYRESKLTQLLQEQIGGNFKTRALICLKSRTDPEVTAAVLRFAKSLSFVQNFPIINDGLAQALLTQKEARWIDIKQQTNMTSTAPIYGETQEELRRLQTENLVLKDHNERLQIRLDALQNKFGDVANTKTDLSQQLLLSEEEKLKVSQSLVDLQIENNKIREEAEASKFELTNKIILLENQVTELESEKERYKKAATYSKERLAELEKDRKDLADEYVVLKTNYLALTKEHQRESGRNEELAIELLNLVNNKAALMRQVAILTNTDPAEVGDPSAEVDRVRAIVAKNATGRVKDAYADEILGTQRDREVVEQTLFASKRKYDSEIERLRKELGDDSKRMETRMTGLMKELADTRNLARERQQKISELNAKLITLRGEKQAIESQLNRMQHKVKDLGEDFRARLVKYVEDISDFVDKGTSGPAQKSEVRLREYCDAMLKDIRRSHREREQQLSEAAQTFRNRLQNTVHKYEELLIAYRNLRQTCEARNFDAADLGPDENELKLSDTEIQTSHLREVDRVKGELAKVRNDLDALKLRYGIFGEDKETMAEITGSVKSDLWSAMRKQLREFTLNTQQQLEQERARLLSENHVLKEQLRESQQYIDSHLVRYKQEIVRLRKMIGVSEDGLILTDRGPRSRINKR